MKSGISYLYGTPIISGVQNVRANRNTKRPKDYLIKGDYDEINGDYRLHVTEYDMQTTPKGDRKFDIVLSADKFDNFLKILRMMD